ncbi:MAG TPA: sugar ABC transporter ATP-binding protein [Micromonosporaceae bacterium]|nr:sugar ABC transporter ATP-binding protein [Micromonosporaceae bacterium]
MPPVLQCFDVRKRFGATEALRGVSLDVAAGEVVALVGENGAGKSTLVRCISGELAPDAGEVRINGTLLDQSTPGRAARLGVAVVHQELSYVGPTSVAENLLLSRLPRRAGMPFLLDRRLLYRQAAAALADIAPDIDVRTRMDDLRVGDRQLVEIARAVGSGAGLVLMDEPTAALTAAEVDALFRAVAVLRARGVGVLYISHRLDEIQRVGDRVIVLRDGARVGSHDVAAVSREQIVAEIVGRQLGAFLREHEAETAQTQGPPALTITGLDVAQRLHPLDLTVRRGEIVGLYGLAGSGVEVVAKAIVGAIPAGGSVRVWDHGIVRRTPASCRRAGLAHVPADRRGEGIFPLQSTGTNIAVSAMAARGMATTVTRAYDRRTGRNWAEQLDIRPRDPDIQIGKLSGGNQQKSVFARWLAIRPRAFLLDEPTRGVDVGAKSQMYDLIVDAAQDGAGILVISSELSELITLCARIGVITRGRLVGVYPTTSVDEQRIVDLAIGGQG